MTKQTEKTEKKEELTPKEALFCKEYLVDLNGTQSVIRAGYNQTPHVASVTATRLLAKARIQKTIQEAFAKRAEKTEITAEFVLENIKEIGLRCLQKKPVMVFNYETRELEQAQDEEGNNLWQFDSSGANKAFRNLGEHLGLFKKVFAGDPENPLFPGIEITRPPKNDDTETK